MGVGPLVASPRPGTGLVNRSEVPLPIVGLLAKARLVVTLINFNQLI